MPPAWCMGTPAPCAAPPALGARLEITEIARAGQASGDAGRIEVVNCSPALPPDLPYGRISAAAGRAAYDYVCAAIDDARAGHIRAIVTAPLNKKSMHEAGIDYPGHTEILAERSGTDDFAMMLANDELRVLLVTIHVALADVMARITPGPNSPPCARPTAPAARWASRARGSRSPG